ncbi:hypothetical protein [Solirubrobacter soli]|nr:hypothetical protein [Solirubrobacter soli]
MISHSCNLSYDERIGFEFLDPGDLLIFGPPDAIRDGAGVA